MFEIKNQKGYIISFSAFLILLLGIIIALSMSSLIYNSQRSSSSSIASTQAYYAAEAGTEDALLKLKNTPQGTFPVYNISYNGLTANVNIDPTQIGGTRVIVSKGIKDSSIANRTVRVVYGIDTRNVNFYYGVQVGDGGLIMNHNHGRVMGNVFSGGNISGSGTIDNNVVVSGNGHSISGVSIGGDALSYSCLSGATINGNLTYVTGGTHTCSVGGTTKEQTQEISQQPMPIPQSQIDAWKSDATAGQVITGNVTKSGTSSLGPAKITGNLTVSGTLTITGTVYVQGNITTSNNTTIKLSSLYGSLGGVIISDGIISTGNGNAFSGSGQEGSYLLVISTNTADTAISFGNNTTGGAFYTTQGGLNVPNNVSVLEITGYKLILGKATIQSSAGTVNIYFSNGPGGSWEPMSWQEE